MARRQHGPLHGMVEKIKYELTAFLGGTQREVGGCPAFSGSQAMHASVGGCGWGGGGRVGVVCRGRRAHVAAG